MPNDKSTRNSFVARVWDDLHAEWRPIYQAPDATDLQQGEVYLSDAINSTLNAKTGMTAATPAAVKKAYDNAEKRILNQAGVISNTLLGENSVTTDKILNGTIKTEDLADKIITKNKLADNSVTSSNIVNGTITGNKVANNSITSTHIVDGTIVYNDLSSELKAKIDAAQIQLTANRAVVSNSSGVGLTVSTTTSTELGYLHGVTSSVQDQLDDRALKNHTHNYAGSSSAGGAANSVAGALTIQLNGTSQGDYNGSAAKTVNITAASVGAASSSHGHSAADITSGTLAVGRGGTGVTSNPSMLVNIGSTSAANVFAASPRPGITGTLAVSHGGTGATDRGGSLANGGLLYNIGIMAGTANPSGTATNGCIYIKYVN